LAGAPMIKSVQRSSVQVRKVVKNRIPGPPVEAGLYRAPNAGTKISIMSRVYPPIMDDCQGFSLDGGISSSCSSP
ncbi:hypothetical protein A2U01_0045416, partial [Trifolium medium]|nr:hypothetical protein [Trifolium medium]